MRAKKADAGHDHRRHKGLRRDRCERIYKKEGKDRCRACLPWPCVLHWSSSGTIWALRAACPRLDGPGVELLGLGGVLALLGVYKSRLPISCALFDGRRCRPYSAAKAAMRGTNMSDRILFFIFPISSAGIRWAVTAAAAGNAESGRTGGERDAV